MTDIQQLLIRARTAFEALPEDEQRKMIDEQRQSWVRGEMGLDRDNGTRRTLANSNSQGQSVNKPGANTIPDAAVLEMPERIYAMPKSDTKHCVVAFDEASLDYHIEYVRADLAAQNLGWRVKDLEWRQEENGDLIAESAVGWYHICLPNRTWNLTTPQGSILSFDTLESAKSAAQADFTRRASSMLEAGETISAENVHDYVQEYEWRGEGADYTPNDDERAMIEDAINGFVSDRVSISPTPFHDTRASVLEEARLWTNAQAEELAMGWTYDCSEIERVRDEAANQCGYDATLEFTESVMKIADDRIRAILAEVRS